MPRESNIWPLSGGRDDDRGLEGIDESGEGGQERESKRDSGEGGIQGVKREVVREEGREEGMREARRDWSWE